MKNHFIWAIVLLTVFAFSQNIMAAETTSPLVQDGKQQRMESGETRILIAYFSRVGSSAFGEDVDAVSSASTNVINSQLIGNTTIIANMIQKTVGGDLFQIVTTKPYPENYHETTDVASREQRKNARPELATHVANMDDYDVVFIGYPNWWATIPMALFTFFEAYDFSGKTVIPFCTHEGSYLGRSVSDIKKLCPQSKVLKGIALRGRSVRTSTAREDIANWLADLDLLKDSN